MRTKTIIITLLSVASFAVGCKPGTDKSAAENREAPTPPFEKVKKETKEAAQAIKDYTYAQKAECVQAMEEHLSELKRELEELSAKVEKAGEAAKTEAQPRIQELREHTDKLRTKLEEARAATESTWDDVKAGLERVYGEAKERFQQARQWISEKIAP